jgi:probable F420-dependent oxidoreductase
MLELARDRADGAHTYFVPVDHTAYARERLGQDRELVVEQAVVLESDAARARAVARTHTHRYLGLANYRNNLLRLGFDESEFENGGSDALVDRVVPWGSDDAVAERVRAHFAAGATEVLVQVITDEPQRLPVDELERLAPALA